MFGTSVREVKKKMTQNQHTASKMNKWTCVKTHQLYLKLVNLPSYPLLPPQSHKKKCMAILCLFLLKLIHDIKQTKYTHLFLRYWYHNITLNIPTYYGLQGPIIKESNLSNKAWNLISHVCIQLTWCNRVKWLKYRHFFVQFLYKCDGSWYTRN